VAARGLVAAWVAHGWVAARVVARGRERAGGRQCSVGAT
jgi:hypothetical protein